VRNVKLYVKINVHVYLTKIITTTATEKLYIYREPNCTTTKSTQQLEHTHKRALLRY